MLDTTAVHRKTVSFLFPPLIYYATVQHFPPAAESQPIVVCKQQMFQVLLALRWSSGCCGCIMSLHDFNLKQETPKFISIVFIMRADGLPWWFNCWKQGINVNKGGSLWLLPLNCLPEAPLEVCAGFLLAGLSGKVRVY